MHRVLITAQVDDMAGWEKRFRTHGDLFKEQTISVVNFAAIGDNEVACVFECDDLDKYMELLESQATADAMDADGVNRDTVKITVLDKEFAP